MSSSAASRKVVAANILQLFNAESKEIFKVRVNPVLTVGGLKQRVATRYGLKDLSDVIIKFNGVKFDSMQTQPAGVSTTTMIGNSDYVRRKLPQTKASRTPSPRAAAQNSIGLLT